MTDSEEIQQKILEDANATEGSRSPTPSVHEEASVPSKRNKDINTSASKKKKVQEGQNNEEGKRKSIRPESWVWQHFTSIKNRDPNWPRASCNWCGASYASHKRRDETSNMAHHLEKQCKKFPRESLDSSQDILSFQPKRKEQGEGTGSNLSSVSFDLHACRQALARMTIVDKLPFKFVEGEGFWYFMSVVQPLFSIPSRVTVARDCYRLFLDEKRKLKNVLSLNSQSVCLTTECWTSVLNLSYLCLTVHFIDAEWKLHKRILNFCPIVSHKGEVIGQTIEKCLTDWGIERVFTITIDNASSNDVAIAYLRRQINEWNTSVMKGEYMDVRCCVHILNLVVADGLKEMHESISKIRDACKYVRASPARMQKFKKCIELAKIQDKSMVQLDVPTRWNSTYLMLESALKFQKAFLKLEEWDAQFLFDSPLGPPNTEDWLNARYFVKFLKIFFDATKNVSSSLHVTSSQYFHEYCLIVKTLKGWCESDDDALLKNMAIRMKAKHDKYWGSIKNMNMFIFVAIILDPRYKLKFVEWSLSKLFDQDLATSMADKVKEILNDMHDKYKSCYSVKKSEDVGQSSQSSREVNISSVDAKDSFIMEFEMDMSKDDNVEHKSELETYLTDPREKMSPKFDILSWWKVNSTRFPILAQIARDVLAIPMSTVASESAFSTGGRVLDQYRSSLSPRTVEALICAQNWFRSTPLSLDMEEQADDIDKAEIDEAGPLAESGSDLDL